MSLNAADIQRMADRVLAAQDRAEPIARLTDEYPAMTIADGYAVQGRLAQLWQGRGDRLVGHKAGLTSKPKMQQMGIDVPSFGVLTSAMACPEGSDIETGRLIHPRVEAEIAFVMAAALEGDCTIEQVLAATDHVMPAIEVIDSRFKDFRFDLPSVIADNGSSARYVAGGRPRRVADLDLRTLGVVLEKNGEIVALGAGAAVLNHPAQAVVMLVRHLASQGRSLPAGSFVMTGGITEAIPVAAGDNVTARFQELGSVSARFL
jgi:2-oxo-3-hexenedioate decarboxylase